MINNNSLFIIHCSLFILLLIIISLCFIAFSFISKQRPSLQTLVCSSLKEISSNDVRLEIEDIPTKFICKNKNESIELWNDNNGEN